MAGSLRCVVLACLLLLTACVGVGPMPEWPAELPPRDYFVQTWSVDAANAEVQARDDYLEWVQRFYAGNNLVPGWTGMTEQLRTRLEPPRWPPLAARLQELGARIAAEWAKDNSVRRINTRCAAVWRDALQEALVRDDLAAFLDRLEQDVDALLAGNLDADTIRFERYYVDEFDF